MKHFIELIGHHLHRISNIIAQHHYLQLTLTRLYKPTLLHNKLLPFRLLQHVEVIRS